MVNPATLFTVPTASLTLLNVLLELLNTKLAEDASGPAAD
jgi:hypothetical protein